MITYVVVGFAALAVAALTLFSGFGLGTLLMPVFALFFPVEAAVAATAVVHGLNNLFKLALLRRDVVGGLLLRFGLPAVAAAFAGAFVLTALARRPMPLAAWSALGRRFDVTAIGLVMGALILLFAVVELSPRLRSIRLDPKWLPLGGAVSGFFGGLSGHQGALRAAFLGRLELTPAQFAGTQAALACMVDAARLLVYGTAVFLTRFAAVDGRSQWRLIAFATLCAFVGSLLARQLLEKITLGLVHVLTGALLLVVGTALAAGVV